MTVPNIKTIPKDIDALRGLMTARQWEKAAHAWAFVGSGKYSPAEFAAFGVNGFRAQHTVRAYVAKWQEAIESGDAIPVAPGMQFSIPNLPWQMESDATRGSRVDDADAYAVAAEAEGTTVGMAIRAGSSVPAFKAAIKADPKVAEAARQALREAFEERRDALIAANKKAKADCDMPAPADHHQDEDLPPEPKSTPVIFLRMVKLDRDLRQLQDELTGYKFENATAQATAVKALNQFAATVAACKSLILDGSVSDQAEDYLRALS